jgi:hypothetical protein
MSYTATVSISLSEVSNDSNIMRALSSLCIIDFNFNVHHTLVFP